MYYYLTVTKCEFVGIRTQFGICFVADRCMRVLRDGPTRVRTVRDLGVMKKTDPVSETLFLKKGKQLDMSKIVVKFMKFCDYSKYQ
jgi:hypothetical protein